MKINNPHVKKWIEKGIPNSETNPYFLWEDTDIEKFHELINGTSAKKDRETLLEKYKDKSSLNFDPQAVLNELTHELRENRRVKSLHEINAELTRLFPLCPEMYRLNELSKNLLNIKRARKYIDLVKANIDEASDNLGKSEEVGLEDFMSCWMRFGWEGLNREKYKF